jgi:hypothetical protein
VKRILPSLLAVLVGGAAVAACNGTTGDQLITFPAYAAGARGAGDPFLVPAVTGPKGEILVPAFTVQLTYAHMYVGAVYVNEAPAQNGSTFDTPACIDTGIYCAQVPGGLDVNLLSTTPQAFPVQGSGSADLGQSWEIYLTQGDVNQPENTGFGVPDTADLVGTATEADGTVITWAATVTINASNRGIPAQEPGQPGLNPICKQRIVELSGIDIQFEPGGTMRLTIDPRRWFDLPIDFSTLPLVAATTCTNSQSAVIGDAQYCIPDFSNLSGGVLGSQQGINLFKGITTGGNTAFSLSYSASASTASP